MKSIVLPNVTLDATPLRADLRYLRVSVNGKAVLMVLGYVDSDRYGRPVHVWYSGDGEVLRTQGGRLVGLTGTPVEWSNVRLPPGIPAWDHLPVPYRYTRTHDEMPGYRWLRVEHVSVRAMDAPSGTAIEKLSAGALTWLEETFAAPSRGPARYAFAKGVKDPVYVEQCLNEAFCLSWQTWPPPSAGVADKR